jgi:Predicted sugar kinase
MTLDARHQAARVIGAGLDPARIPELGDLLELDDFPTVLDATALDPSLNPFVVARGGTWLTPHVGEAARLLGLDVETVLQHPLEAARDLATTWNAGVVLKTAGAVVAAPNGSTYVVAAGHPGMASGGTGDVLAGALGAALASLAAADHDAARDWTHASMRVAAAVQLHARAGEDAGRSLGVGFTAHELADTLPRTRQRLMGAW